MIFPDIESRNSRLLIVTILSLISCVYIARLISAEKSLEEALDESQDRIDRIFEKFQLLLDHLGDEDKGASNGGGGDKAAHAESQGVNFDSLEISRNGLILRNDNYEININGKGITVLPWSRGSSRDQADCEKCYNKRVDSSSAEEGSSSRKEDETDEDDVVCDGEEEEEEEVRILNKNYGTIHYEIHHNRGTVNIDKFVNYGDIHVNVHHNVGTVRIGIYNGDKKGRVFIYSHGNRGNIAIFRDYKGTTELMINNNNYGRISEDDLKPDGRLKGKYIERDFHTTQKINDHNNKGHRDL